MASIHLPGFLLALDRKVRKDVLAALVQSELEHGQGAALSGQSWSPSCLSLIAAPLPVAPTAGLAVGGTDRRSWLGVLEQQQQQQPKSFVDC